MPSRFAFSRFALISFRGTLAAALAFILLAVDPLPAQQSLKFADSFDKNSLADYTAKGKVEAHQGAVRLSGESELGRALRAGPVAKWTADLAVGKGAAGFQFVFSFHDRSQTIVELRRKRVDGRTISSAVIRSQGRLPVARSRQLESLPDLPAGRWTVGLRYGLVTLFAGDKELLIADQKGTFSNLESWRIVSRRGELTIRSVAASGEPRLVVTPGIQQKISEGLQLNRQVMTLFRAGRSREALPLAIRSLRLRELALGKSHPAAGVGWLNVAAQHHMLGEFDDATRCYERATAVIGAAMGERHAEFAKSLIRLAQVYSRTGRSQQAEATLSRARRIMQALSTEPQAGDVEIYRTMAMEQLKRGDLTRALGSLQQALDLGKKVLGVESEQHAVTSLLMGGLLGETGQWKRAIPQYQTALAIYEKRFGKNHIRTAATLNNLGMAYMSLGQSDEAKSFLERALEIRRKSLGETHPDIALGLNNLGGLALRSGRPADAESKFRLALKIISTTLGEFHPNYVTSLENLARACAAQGNREEARRRFAEALKGRFRLARQVLSGLPEGQLWAFWRQHRPAPGELLQLLRPEARSLAEEAYGLVWEAKGLATRLLAERRRISSDNKLLQRLQDMRARIAQLTYAWGLRETSQPLKLSQSKARLAAITRLNQQKESIERELIQENAAYRRTVQLRKTTVEQLAAALPKGVVVVDFARVAFRRPFRVNRRPIFDKHYEAFILRAGTSAKRVQVDWIPLGPAPPIDEAIVRWRTAIAAAGSRRAGSRKAGAERDAAGRLRKLLWSKIAPRLEDARTVVVIPDQSLTGVPWAALPGASPDTFLIEEVAVATASSGQQLYEMLTSAAPQGEEMLVVGGLDYGPAGQGVRPNNRPTWPALPGTELESLAVSALFARKGHTEARQLTAKAASEKAVRAGSSRSRYIHLATHGFFADARRLSDRQGLRAEFARNPLVMSGVVLSRANAPRPLDTLGRGKLDDGVLTGDEVIDLDLRNTELVVLSACETGLGMITEGEGVLGLQRAFRMAGARTVVGTLWKVHDGATSLLMERFYANLWSRKQSKLESLREAQLFVMKNPELVDRRSAKLQQQLASRGLKLSGKPIRNGNKQSSPAMWAPFMLSGDWR